MTVRRLPAILTALLLGLSSAYAVACGEEREGLITAGRAESIKSDLDGLDEAVSQGQCEVRARRELANIRRQIANLPASTDRELRERLQEGIDHLESIAPGECEQNRTDTTPTQTETTPTQTETTPTETTPPPTQTETTPTETTPPPTETTPPPTETTPPEPPPGEPPVTPPGGEEAPSGAAGDTP